MSEEKINVRLPSVASSPHIRTRERTSLIMLDVLVALIPALAASVYFFGPRALALTAVTILSTVLSEALYRLGTRQHMTVGDLSAAVTGMILAMTLPVETPYWMAALSGVFAMVVAKQLFGGLGKNFMNPALIGRVFLFSFPAVMGKYIAPGMSFWAPLFSDKNADAVSAATPLASLHNGVIPADMSLRQLWAGQQAGSLGETAAFLLILGGVYLVLRGVISPRIPLCFMGSVAVLTFLFPLGGNPPHLWMAYQLLSGGVVFGAIFMATDYVTSPVTPVGQCIYGVGCGALTVFLRYFGSYPEGVSFAILIMNTLVWALDKAFMPHRFGAPWFWQKFGKKEEKPHG